MTIIFKAQTPEGYAMKLLSELLQNNLRDACFEIDAKGVSLRMNDTHDTICVDLYLNGAKMQKYIYKHSKPKMLVGISLIHFHKMLKTVKKKDSIMLFIDDENPTELCIQVIPKENTRVTTSRIKIHNPQQIQIEDIPQGYDNPINVPSAEYQKMIKELNSLNTPNNNSVISVSAKGFQIKFSCDASGVFSRSVVLGEQEQDDEDIVEYEADFDADKLSRITKIAGLSTNMQIYTKKKLPMLFVSSVGSFGEISVYIKTKENIDDESDNSDSDDN